jgi:hypothetical protein
MCLVEDCLPYLSQGLHILLGSAFLAWIHNQLLRYQALLRHVDLSTQVVTLYVNAQKSDNIVFFFEVKFFLSYLVQNLLN